MKLISFRNDPAYDPDSQSIMFSAIIADEMIPCAITTEALQNHFSSKQRAPLDSFRKHRGAIEEIAERLIASARFEDDGLVLIRTADCSAD